MSFETPGKQWARYMTWRRIRRELGPDRFARCRFLYLAGPDGGDASVLKGFGVPPERQTAVDFDYLALNRFEGRHPDVPTFYGSLTGLAGHFDVVFLDFTWTIANPQLAESVAQGYRCLAHRGDGDGFFAFAILAARETRDRFIQIAAAAAEMKAESRRMSRRRGVDHERVQKLLYGRQGDGGYTSVGRVRAVMLELDPVQQDHRVALAGSFIFSYVGKGNSPMLIAGFRSRAMSRKCSAARFDKRRVQFVDEVIDKRWVDDEDTVVHLGFQPTLYELLAFVEGDGLYDMAHLVLNEPKGRIAALRANRTRMEVGL